MKFLKKNWKFVLTAFIALIIGSLIGPTQGQLDEVNAETKNLEEKLTNESDTVATLKEENKDLQAKVDEAAPWFKLSDEEKKQQEAEAKEAEEKRKAEEKAKEEAEAKAKAEEEAKAKAEAEAKEKQGYNTGVTYDQLARTPDDYIGEKVKFSGKVVQVMEGDGITQIRFAVNDNYDTILLGEFDASVVDSRILEDDELTIYGTSGGVITYESTMGGNITIPSMVIDKIDQ
ncbi:toxin regulator [Terribacillus goriensis]|uniref:toxin regulator n=1 Tax=Terribacillus saccharophilus TaxID=361277 RepID=UPI0039833095